MRILIGADLVPTKSNADLFSNGEVKELIGPELKNLLDSADYRIFNLETPITDTVSPISKCGPCLHAETKTIVGIKQLGTDFLTLANNHIYDQGEEGLLSTIKVLNDTKIAFSGVGKTLSDAMKPYVAIVGDRKIGIFCCAEHEFSIAKDQKSGANPYDPLESFDTVKELRKKCDFLIVLYHGGKEYCRYPSYEVRRMSHKFVDCGADIILCQHTHCIGCAETYKDKRIIYGQGNFLFDNSQREEWQTSLLVECDLEDTSFNVAFHPLRKCGNTVRLAEGTDYDAIIGDFYKRSNELLDDKIWKERYREFAVKSYQQMFSRVSGLNERSFFNRICSRLFGEKYVTNKLKKIYSRNKLLVLRNTVESESWRELLLESIDSELTD